MGYTLFQDEQGIVQVAFIGDLGGEELDQYLVEVDALLETVSEDSPLLMLVDATQAGKLSAKGRQEFFKLAGDSRVRKVAIIGFSRYTKITTQFAMRITGRNHIRIFDEESDAQAWLLEG